MFSSKNKRLFKSLLEKVNMLQALWSSNERDTIRTLSAAEKNIVADSVKYNKISAAICGSARFFLLIYCIIHICDANDGFGSSCTEMKKLCTDFPQFKRCYELSF
jgi:hypothetical protein